MVCIAVGFIIGTTEEFGGEKTKRMRPPYLTSKITVKESGQMTSFAHEVEEMTLMTSISEGVLSNIIWRWVQSKPRRIGQVAAQWCFCQPHLIPLLL